MLKSCRFSNFAVLVGTLWAVTGCQFVTRSSQGYILVDGQTVAAWSQVSQVARCNLGETVLEVGAGTRLDELTGRAGGLLEGALQVGGGGWSARLWGEVAEYGGDRRQVSGMISVERRW